MNKLQGWDDFLEDIADEFGFKGKSRKVFLVRFARENTGEREEGIWQLSKESSLESYKKKMTFIYAQFANSSNGCPNLDGGGAGKFEKLRVWLEEQRYPFWLNGYNPIRSKRYYIERSPVESDCCQELLQSGSFVRIKAPQKMGKTSLLEQVLSNLRNKDYQTLRYDFGLADREFFSDYGQFAYQFCAGITEELVLTDCLEEYWSKNLGSNQNITKYFEKYLLKEMDKPLILALDGVDRVFEHENIAIDFCRLLRSWHDKAKLGNSQGEIWQQLRLIVVHSTDVYSNLNINSSPLAGVGIVKFLRDFTPEEIKDLTRRYELNLDGEQIQELRKLVGGHPYLITICCEYFKNSQVEVSWQEFLQTAPTDAPPFGDRLRQLLWTLKQHPELAQSFTQVINSPHSISLPSERGFKLLSMGLVDIEGNKYSYKCNLYRQYFLNHLEEINP